MSEVKNMIVKTVMDEERLVSLDFLASRWQVSRSTARRILDLADAKPYFLSGATRGVRRYCLRDILQIEQESQVR